MDLFEKPPRLANMWVATSTSGYMTEDLYAYLDTELYAYIFRIDAPRLLVDSPRKIFADESI